MIGLTKKKNLLNQALDLVRLNMKPYYEESSWGWNENKKKKELENEDARFLFVFNKEKQMIAMSHYRFLVEVRLVKFS